jgi:peptidoglycan/xylan/chitin deacetylase (PgdA/CDA1 family)
MENKTRSHETSECVKNPEISFFMYHYIRDDDIHDNGTVRNLSIPPSLFNEQMREVAKLRDESAISLMYGSDFIESWKKNCFEKKKIWIFTTDDSWSDTYSHLAPIAKNYDIPFFF